MWRKVIALGLVCMVGTASAEQTLEETLQSMAVFECEAEGQSTLYVFRTGVNGETILLDDPSVPVRRDGTEYSVITAEGAREISAETYFLYQDGAAISGTCYDATATAQAIFPTMMDGILHGSSEGLAEAEAAAILVEDMRIKTEAEIARVTEELELAQAALAEELASTQEKLTTAETELATANEQLPALFESSDTLTQALDAKEAELAGVTKSLDRTLLELATERAKNEEAQSQVAQLEGDLAEANVALAQEKAVSTLKDTALERAMARSDETAAKLDETTKELEKITQERRALAANVASLNQKASDLAGRLDRTEAELKSAIEDKARSVALVGGAGSLTDVAISRIATLQNRGVSDVQRELCSMISRASRPARCGN